ncbi:2676_t:CDS:2, partial [Gigaspora margarita]
SEKYKKAFDLAFKKTVDEKLRNKFEKMKKLANEARILNDWETLMQQKTAVYPIIDPSMILVRCGVHKTNLNLHGDNTLSLSK